MKPSWMPTETWAKFIKRYMEGDGLCCVACGSTEDMTVDHIVPRVLGGNSEVSNLQPMCRSCNSTKAGKPDTYWNQQFVFDTPLNRGKLRVAQDDYIYGRIEKHAEFFSRPWSSINRKLFLFAQIVGAGKTIGLFALPFALNAVIGRSRPRTDKMLVVTKDMPLRAQIAYELRVEPAQYGIIGKEPIVMEIDTTSKLIDPEKHDIAVMCPNMLWPDKDATVVNLNDNLRVTGAEEIIINWREHMTAVLHRYPLIVFDEMHYAHQNIASLVRAATHNLVFGFTASPVDANGSLLEDMVLMSVYGYAQAAIHDHSMKYLGESRDV